ncbi:hypothetical protein BDP55DRAFT_721376 [Colletotrichum godetiae]|uniref:Uncharacterized protein n=1 Tax=Colletotrichum godetiae TaxID=1209918 RepID=A0AAJ0A6P1_9PEZI|nr:uncharacterized protein BDP55DRAFT_721376 [Colletotrichum godetiae]KAK1657516.1 hypothetical protein BDP55DRAFT_721376 [Colletotrichum godetiae]
MQAAMSRLYMLLLQTNTRCISRLISWMASPQSITSKAALETARFAWFAMQRSDTIHLIMAALKEYRAMHKAEIRAYGAVYPEIRDEEEFRSEVYIRISETVVNIELQYKNIMIPKAEFDLVMGNHGQNAVLRHTLQRKHKPLRPGPREMIDSSPLRQYIKPQDTNIDTRVQ